MARGAARRRAEATAKKARRKKIFAIVGICVLLVVLGIQVPRTLDLLSGETEETTALAPALPAPTPTAPTTSTTKAPPEAKKLLSSPTGSDPFVPRTVAITDSNPAMVAGPGGIRDPFLPASVATVIAPKRIVIGTPTAGQTPTVGYIVVLASIRTSAGRGIAERIARNAREDGLRPVGVLNSSTSRPLRAGYFVAYVGPYASGSAVFDAKERARALGYRTAYIRELVRYDG